MASRQSKTEMVAFKVEREIAEFLARLPNKSEFIRQAIIAQFSASCPLCRGSGMVPPGIHDCFAPIIAEHLHSLCSSCGETTPFPMDLAGLDGDEYKRFERFFHGGPLYCAGCYQVAPECDDCGWHLDPGQLPEHVSKAHPKP